jgi:hypothetical protein
MAYALAQRLEVAPATRPLTSLCYSWWRERYGEIMRDANGELYLYRYHCNIGYSDYYYRFRNAQDLAAAIFDLDEYQILEFPETGHWAVSLPKEVRDEIWKTTSSRGTRLSNGCAASPPRLLSP